VVTVEPAASTEMVIRVRISRYVTNYPINSTWPSLRGRRDELGGRGTASDASSVVAQAVANLYERR